MTTRPADHRTLTLVGAGRLGRTLARLWLEREVFTPGKVCARTMTSAQSAVDFIGSGQPSALDMDPFAVGLALIAVPDDQLANAARWLADRAEILPDAVIFHCSGAHTCEVLEPLRTAGACVASVHPMHSFADPATSLETFHGSFCAMEGDPEALEVLRLAFEAIGGRPLEIHGASKLLYHAGGVFASNYLTVLIDAALRLLAEAGIDASTGRQLLAPLVRGAVDSALALGPGPALTGPVVRGDAQLVARQALAVEDHQADLGTLYRLLAHSALQLAAREGRLEPQQIRELEAGLDRACQPSSMRTPTTQSVAAKP